MHDSRLKWIAGLLLLSAAALFPRGLHAAEFFQHVQSAGTFPVVVVDPGHGGNDKGVTGPSGRTEKSVSTELAVKLRDRLAGRYRVVLTRTGDYDVPLAQRASRANHQGGDVFVSLHAGGAFRGSVSRWGIYHSPYSDTGSRADKSAKSDDLRIHCWQDIQQQHVGASAMLARKVRERLELARIQADPEILQAPLVILQGLDMPAIVVEYGYLTHPAIDRACGRDAWLDTVAAAVERGISDFFAAGMPAD